ncbi:MAG: FAD:protein FMN transferase, partial [Anaerolineales bacterium]
SRRVPVERRDFLKISAVSGAVVAGAAAGGWALRRGQAVKVQETRLLMGTIINMTVLAESRKGGEAAVEATLAEMARLVQLYDHRRADGPLGRLNREGRLAQAPAELVAVLTRALEYGEVSGGAFDITVKPVVEAYAEGKEPAALQGLVDYRKVKIAGDTVQFDEAGMQVTLDGIAKGTVVDGAVAKLGELGYQQVLVEAGGDLRAGGAGQRWRVAVDHPRQEVMEGFVAAFDLVEQSVATSGDYMNSFSQDRSSHHIVDPRLGVSPRKLASTTVVAPTATDADALSTALMVLGVEAGLALAEKLAGVEALVVTKDLSVHRTKGFPRVQED